MMRVMISGRHPIAPTHACAQDYMIGCSNSSYVHKSSLEVLTVLPVYRCHFSFFDNAFILSCWLGTLGDLLIRVCMHIDTSLLSVCV
jgi:hypothetical protein